MATIHPDLGRSAQSSPAGLRWLIGLEALASRHGLSEIRTPLGRSGGALYPCLAHDRPAVLKIGPAGDVGPEVEALICWRSRDLAPELLSSEIPAAPPLDAGLGVLVLAQSNPGTPLPALGPDQGRELFLDLLSRFYPPLPFTLRREREALRMLGLRDFRRSVDEGLRSLGPEHKLANGVRMGQFSSLADLVEQLVETSDPGRWRLLHGDLHGHNLLLDEGKLKAIDPIPYWGEPELDLGRALIGPPLLPLPPVFEEAAEILASASATDAPRIVAWARVFGALRLASEGDKDALEPARRGKLLGLLADLDSRYPNASLAQRTPA